MSTNAAEAAGSEVIDEEVEGRGQGTDEGTEIAKKRFSEGKRAERNLDDTEYLAREIVALRLLVRDMASQDFVRDELKALLEELDKREVQREAAAAEAEDEGDLPRREQRTARP